MVMALTAEMIIDAEMVKANWRKNWPVIPPRNALGRNTELSTSVMAMIGPVISFIAPMVASRTGRPFSSHRSMFSSTTMASSTTMPMASTSPNSVRLLSENPSKAHDGERADQRDADVDHREEERLPVLKEQQDDNGHQDHRLAQGVEDLIHGLADERGGVVDDGILEPSGNRFSSSRILALMRSPTSRAFDPGS